MSRRRATQTPDYLAALRRMVRAAGARCAMADPEELAQLVELRFDLDAAIREAVVGLRSSGITWQSIGEATGTTRQAAIQKWAPSYRARQRARQRERATAEHQRQVRMAKRAGLG